MRFAGGLLLLLFSSAVRGAEIGPGDDIRAAIAGLSWGETPSFRGGVYVLSSSFRVTVAGTQSSPIVIRSKPGERAHMSQDNPSQNIIEVSNSRYLELRDLQQGLPRHTSHEFKRHHHREL